MKFHPLFVKDFKIENCHFIHFLAHILFVCLCSIRGKHRKGWREDFICSGGQKGSGFQHKISRGWLVFDWDIFFHSTWSWAAPSPRRGSEKYQFIRCCCCSYRNVVRSLKSASSWVQKSFSLWDFSVCSRTKKNHIRLTEFRTELDTVFFSRFNKARTYFSRTWFRSFLAIFKQIRTFRWFPSLWNPLRDFIVVVCSPQASWLKKWGRVEVGEGTNLICFISR